MCQRRMTRDPVGALFAWGLQRRLSQRGHSLGRVPEPCRGVRTRGSGCLTLDQVPRRLRWLRQFRTARPPRLPPQQQLECPRREQSGHASRTLTWGPRLQQQLPQRRRRQWAPRRSAAGVTSVRDFSRRCARAIHSSVGRVPSAESSAATATSECIAAGNVTLCVCVCDAYEGCDVVCDCALHCASLSPADDHCHCCCCPAATHRSTSTCGTSRGTWQSTALLSQLPQRQGRRRANDSTGPVLLQCVSVW